MLTVASFLVSIAGVAAIIQGNKNEFLSVNTTTTAKGFLALVIVLHHLAVQMNQPESIFYQWGGAGTALFIFFSGYGVWFSIHRAKSVATWIVKHIFKLLLPFLIVLVFFEMIECFVSGNRNISIVAKDVFTLSLPHYTNWFVKAILVMYIVSALALLISRKIPHSYEIIVLFGCITWILVCKLLHLSSFWYNSILAFALGSFVARFKDRTKRLLCEHLWQVFAVLTVCSIVVVWHVGSLSGTIGNLVFCLDALLIIGRCGAESKSLFCFGTMSFEIYLWHLLIKYYLFMSPLPTNTIVILVIILSLLAAFITNQIIGRRKLG